jgi:hypothetical protein
MLLTMTEIVFDVVATGGEHIVALVFMFPACAPRVDDRLNGSSVNGQRRDEAVVVKAGALCLVGNRHVAPIDPHRIVTRPEGDVTGPTVPPYFTMTTIPLSFLELGQLAAPFHTFYPLVKQFMEGRCI